MKLKTAMAAVLAAGLVTSSVAFSAGYFPGFPQWGGPATCDGASVPGIPGTTAVCNVTVPAGPTTSLTGSESAAFDTGLASGQAPQTVLISTGMLAPGNSGANALIGADFGLNLWQRGTTAANGNSITPSTATWVADAWYVYSSGNTVAVSKQTGATDVFAGTLASMRVGRPSGSNVTAICTGQILPVKESQRFLGSNAVFSAYMLAGAGLSSGGGNVTMTIAYYTAADSVTSGTNTGTFASSIGATQNITGYIEAVNTSVPVTTIWTRFSTSAAIPALNAAGTAVTGVGVKLCYTPVGTGGATDYFEVALPQFEPRSGPSTAPSAFNRRLPTEEWQAEYARVFESSEASEGVIHGMGQAVTTTLAEAYIQFPVEQRLLVPTATYANGFGVGTSSGAINLCTTTAQGSLGSTASLKAMLGANGATVACTIGAAALVAGNATMLVDDNSTGNMQFASEP